MNSLAKSESMVASIVAFLAERGVERTDFTVVELGYELTEENDQLFTDAMVWLTAEGIIRSNGKYAYVGGENDETRAISFSLTSYGFALLRQRYDGDLTLGSAIQKAKSSTGGFSNMGDLVGGILGGFTKSISS